MKRRFNLAGVVALALITLALPVRGALAQNITGTDPVPKIPTPPPGSATTAALVFLSLV